ncbi:nuclear transport factor 2 family protein [Streptacidiphilus monticola]|uniref:Nuclear transport factor 2 family protein n=1 Tax=Streptacidiphilus monticola TaxID=2161674 RepID=A0ABW1G8Z3_9ACTN
MTTAQTTTARDAAEALQEFFTRFGSGDRSGALELFGEETDFEVPGAAAVPWTGRRRTREEIGAFLDACWTLVDTEAFAVDRILADGGHAVALGSFTHRVKSTGKPFTSSFALHIEVRDGLIRGYRMHEDSHAALEAFTA